MSLTKRLIEAGWRGPHPLASWRSAAERKAEADAGTRRARPSSEAPFEPAARRPRQASTDPIGPSGHVPLPGQLSFLDRLDDEPSRRPGRRRRRDESTPLFDGLEP